MVQPTATPRLSGFVPMHSAMESSLTGQGGSLWIKRSRIAAGVLAALLMATVACGRPDPASPSEQAQDPGGEASAAVALAGLLAAKALYWMLVMRVCVIR